jgi:dipeptidyl aminopeptidase/acylaminoacyl peptidase
VISPLTIKQCKKWLAACTALSIMLIVNITQAGDRMTPELLWKLGRIGEVAVSPDGTQVAYLVTRYDLDENSGKADLFVQEIPPGDTKPGQPTKQSAAFETPLQSTSPKSLLKDAKGINSVNWIQRPEGLRLIYLAPTEGEKSTSQAWMLDPANPKPRQISKFDSDISNLKPSPTGESIAFTIDITMDDDVRKLYPDLPKADARIIDSLLYRHWNAWHDYAYSHVHVAKLNESGDAGEAVDLMRGLRADCPVPPFGGAEQFDFSPDGKQMTLTIKLVNNPAESTDTSLFLVSIDGGPLTNITPGMHGYDMEPAYSPDGRFIAFHSMERAGFEADRNRIMLYDRASGNIRELTQGLDQTTHHAFWSEDSSKLFFDSEHRGTMQVFEIDVASGAVRQVTRGRFDFSAIAATTTGLLVKQQSMLRPTELAVVGHSNQEIATITDVNGSIFTNLELPKVEERMVKATDGQMIHNWVIMPPDYDPASTEQWPMLTYCQGGPQGQIGQWFSYRWNFHLMAAQGYAVLAVNRRGMPGFGQAWNDQISGDWGGQAMQDILAATDAMMADPSIDRQRVAAVGASFGGYTVYWLMGNSGERFAAMIAHCGVFNLESMYGSTEELFFVNHDLGGPYWKNSKLANDYEKFSPHKFVGNWKTPLLVIHGEKDFRVPITQGMEAFTAAKVQGIPSRFLYFPNEGHWVNSPQNSVLWNRVFFEWLERYCKNK